MEALPFCPWSGRNRDKQFLPRFTNSRCAGYILFLDTEIDSSTDLAAAKAGFPLVKSWKKLLCPCWEELAQKGKRAREQIPDLDKRIGQTANAPVG